MAFLAQLLDDVVVHKFELQKTMTQIGRRPNCDIVIEDSAVSGTHARIELKANAYFDEYKECYIEDLGSTNGTFVNDDQVSSPVRLHHNDIVKIAFNRFKFIDDSEQEMEKTVHLIRTQSSL